MICGCVSDYNVFVFDELIQKFALPIQTHLDSVAYSANECFLIHHSKILG